MIREVAILVRLRLRLLFAAFASKSIAAAVIGFLVLSAVAVSFGASSYVSMRATLEAAAEGDGAPAMLRLVFLSTFLMLSMTGVAFLATSDFFDTTRLLHLPVRPRSVFVAMLGSSVFAPATLVLAAPAVGAVLALPSTSAALCARLFWVLALAVFGQACALGIGHAMLLALNRRRVRDIATILGSVLGVGSYLLLRFVGSRPTLRPASPDGSWWSALRFSPTSWFSDAALELWVSPADVLAPLLATAGALVFGAASFTRFFDRAGETGDGGAVLDGDIDRGCRGVPRAASAVFRATSAVVWREPELRALLFQQMVFLVVPVVTASARNDAAVARWMIPFFVVLSHAWLATSLLGVDGSGLPLLLQSPAPRRELLLGRVIAAMRLFFVVDVVAVAALGVLMAVLRAGALIAADLVTMSIACVVADGMMIAAGVFVSVVAPHPLLRRRRGQRVRLEGCATHAGRMLFRLPVMALAVAVGLVAILPRFLPIEPVWYAITVPAAALTVFHSAWFCVAAAARRLGAREEEILAALSDSGD